MTNSDIVTILHNIVAAYTVTNENVFRIRAYQKAADTISVLTSELKDLWINGKLETVNGIGKTIASHLDELFRTGKVGLWDHVLGKLPQGMFILLQVPGIGPQKAFRLAKEFHLYQSKTAVDMLLEAAQRGKIAPLEGFGEKSQADIIEGLKQFKKGSIKENRMPLPYAFVIAQELLTYLKQNKAVLRLDVLGSLRRNVSTIGDIDIAVATYKPEEIIQWFLAYSLVSKLIEKGPTGASVLLTNGKQVDLRVIKPTQYGSMLQYFTGSKNHNIRFREFALKQGWSVNEYGMKPLLESKKSKIKSQNHNSKLKIYEFDKETEFYKALGLAWIPPELREDRGEIERASKNSLPKLVELSDIKGDFHIHSNYDLQTSHDLGNSSIDSLVHRAGELGYEYVGISDHNPSHSNHNDSEIVSILKRRKDYIEHIKTTTKSTRVQIVTMLEVDILPDGKLSIPNEAFDYLDACIVSIHSSFKQDKETMTNRIISGLSHPKAKILAHPSGRLLGSREGYEVDWEQLFSFCRQKNKAIEINAFPQRLDLSDVLVKQAIESGVKLTIDTDSHDVSHMDLMQYGVSVARRGWAEKSDILNTKAYNNMKDWLLS